MTLESGLKLARLFSTMEEDDSPIDHGVEERTFEEKRSGWKPRISQAEFDAIDTKFGFARMNSDSPQRTGWLLNMKPVLCSMLIYLIRHRRHMRTAL